MRFGAQVREQEEGAKDRWREQDRVYCGMETGQGLRATGMVWGGSGQLLLRLGTCRCVEDTGKVRPCTNALPPMVRACGQATCQGSARFDTVREPHTRRHTRLQSCTGTPQVALLAPQTPRHSEVHIATPRCAGAAAAVQAELACCLLLRLVRYRRTTTCTYPDGHVRGGLSPPAAGPWAH